MKKKKSFKRPTFSCHLLVSGRRDGSHVEQLTGVILDATEHHHGDGVALGFNHLQDVLRPESLFSLTATGKEQVTYISSFATTNVNRMLAKR